MDGRDRRDTRRLNAHAQRNLRFLHERASVMNGFHSSANLFVLQHFHRLFLRETETRNTGASENLEGAGRGRLLEERVAAIQ